MDKTHHSRLTAQGHPTTAPPDLEFIEAMSRNNILMLPASGTAEYGQELLATVKSLPTGVNA